MIDKMTPFSSVFQQSGLEELNPLRVTIKGELLLKSKTFCMLLTFTEKLEELERCENGFERHFINIHVNQVNKIRLYAIKIKKGRSSE